MLPEYEFLSAPLWLITVLHLVTLTLHFLAMNFLVGGVVAVLFLRPGGWDTAPVQRFVKAFPTAMAATVTLGVAPLLFLQLVYYDQVYSAAIVSGWLWFLIVPVVIVVYYLLYGAAMGRRGKALLLLLSLVGLIYVSFVYSTVFSMAERPAVLQRLYAACQSGLTVNDQAGTWVVRWLHMLVGAVTVGGFFVALLGKDDEGAFRVGKRVFLGGMVGSFILGLAYLMTLGEVLPPLMRSWGIWLILVSLILSLAALHFTFRQRFSLAGLTLGLSLLGMVTVRHILRLLVLDGSFDPSTIPVQPRWDVFLIFVICFVAALATVALMGKLFRAGRAKPVD